MYIVRVFYKENPTQCVVWDGRVWLLRLDLGVVRGSAREPGDIGRDVEPLAGHMAEVAVASPLEDGFSGRGRVHDRGDLDWLLLHLSHLLCVQLNARW